MGGHSQGFHCYIFLLSFNKIGYTTISDILRLCKCNRYVYIGLNFQQQWNEMLNTIQQVGAELCQAQSN